MSDSRPPLKKTSATRNLFESLSNLRQQARRRRQVNPYKNEELPIQETSGSSDNEGVLSYLDPDNESSLKVEQPSRSEKLDAENLEGGRRKSKKHKRSKKRRRKSMKKSRRKRRKY